MKLFVKLFSVFLFSLIVTACSQDKSPEKTAEIFLKAGYSGDVDAVMDLLYIPDSKKDNKETEIKMLVKSKLQESLTRTAKKTEERGGIAKIVCSSTEYLNDDKTLAKVKASVVFNDGSKDDSDVSLIKVDNKWLVKK